MTIATQCPHCQTVFRITPEQLQARAGRVRCGRCQQVFDGFKTLRALDAPTPVVEPQADIAPPQKVDAEPQPAAALLPAPSPASPSTAAEPPSPDLLAALQPSADFLAQFGGTGAVAEPAPDIQQETVHDTITEAAEISPQTEPPLAEKFADVDTPGIAPELLAAVQPSEEFLAQFSPTGQSPAADPVSAPETMDVAATAPLTETPSVIWPPAPDVPQPVMAARDELNFIEPVEALTPEEAAVAEYNAMMASNATADEATQDTTQDSVAQDDVYAKLSLAPASITPTQEHSAVSLPAEELPPAQEQEQPSRRHKRWWAFAATLAALALALQGMHAYRSELASSYPALKPLLSQWCAWVRCSVPPLQRPTALNIEASDLQVVDQSRPNIVQLTATLRNKSVSEVGYPALDLVLTDNREHALARRVFVPADYLHAVDAGKAVIAANAEVTVRIDLDVSGLAAAGFRLNLAAAPSI